MKIVTLGEIMIRLQPYDHLRFVQTDTLQYTYGGGEANVAVSLANYGADVAFVTKLPAHAIGQAGVNALRRYGVDTSKITRGGDRVGIYFNEKGASQRGSVCIYDRANSDTCTSFCGSTNNYHRTGTKSTDFFGRSEYFQLVSCMSESPILCLLRRSFCAG